MHTQSDSPPESHMQLPTAKRFGSPYTVKYDSETIGYESSFALDTCLVETSDEDERSLRAGSTEGEVSNIREHIDHATAPTLDRYFKQKKSAHGKLAYVVFAGNNVGVFYNWTTASMAISGLNNSSKVYKGYTSYQKAHSAWDGFVSTGCLPSDVAVTLGSRPYPTPPSRVSAPPSTPSHVSAPPTTPKRVRANNHHSASPLPLQTPYTPRSGRSVTPRSGHNITPRSGHSVTPLGGPSSSTYAIPITSPTSPGSPTSMRSRNAAAFAVVREESFRADQEDFWVVFTGTAPGVYQGREAGERAFGQFENPSFVRTSARDNANQIFVDGYMELLVVRYVN